MQVAAHFLLTETHTYERLLPFVMLGVCWGWVTGWGQLWRQVAVRHVVASAVSRE